MNRRLIPALPTLEARAFFPSLSPRPRPRFPLDLVEPPSGAEPAPPTRHAALYHLARNGVFHGLRALSVGAGHTVLMPAYHHGVEVEAVRRTGARVAFYRVDRHLVADLDHAERLAQSLPSVRALYLTYFAGFPQPLDEALALCRRRELLLVEDCALSLFSAAPSLSPQGSAADLAIFCLYKTLPVPHGGLAITRAPLPRPSPPPLFSTLRHLAGSLRARAALHGESRAWDAVHQLERALADRRARWTGGHLSSLAFENVQVGTSHLHPARLSLGASAVVPFLLRRVDAEAVVVRRRRNYTRLLEAIGGPEEGTAFSLPRGTNPLFFPLLVDDKRDALARMAALGVEAVDFWSGGDPACDARAFPETTWLRRHLLEVPIHQDLDDELVDRVARVVKSVPGHASHRARAIARH